MHSLEGARVSILWMWPTINVTSSANFPRMCRHRLLFSDPRGCYPFRYYIDLETQLYSDGFTVWHSVSKKAVLHSLPALPEARTEELTDRLGRVTTLTYRLLAELQMSHHSSEITFAVILNMYACLRALEITVKAPPPSAPASYSSATTAPFPTRQVGVATLEFQSQMSALENRLRVALDLCATVQLIDHLSALVKSHREDPRTKTVNLEPILATI
jgi:hypothetical protein